MAETRRLAVHVSVFLRAAIVIAALLIPFPTLASDLSKSLLGIELTFRMSHPHLTVSGTGMVSFAGTRERLREQNARADSERLDRFTRATFDGFKSRDELVPLEPSASISLDPRTPDEFHVLRPWTHRFVERLALDFFVAFGRPLQVNSASRTKEYQRSLQGRNPNAASAYTPETSSLHLRGITFDIAKLERLSPNHRPKAELEWLAAYLALAQRSGTVEVTEEFTQAVFHVVVFKAYEPQERSSPILLLSARR